MSLTLEQSIGQQFLLSFTGKRKPPVELLRVLQSQHIGGIVLFRARNMGTLFDLRQLTRTTAKSCGTLRPTTFADRCRPGGRTTHGHRRCNSLSGEYVVRSHPLGETNLSSWKGSWTRARAEVKVYCIKT